MITTLKQCLRTSAQDGGIGKHASGPHATTERITTGPQNKNHPDPSENRAVWKSDNQGLKEACSRRLGGGAEMQRQAERCGDSVWCREVAAAGGEVLHLHVAHKNQEGHLGSK